MSSSLQTMPMGRRVQIDHDEQTIGATRKLRESGGSTVLTIPQEILDSVGFEAGDQVEISADMFGDEIRLHLASSEE